MFKKSQTKIKSFDQTELFLQHWSKPESIGTILITHGQGEHSDCYERLINGLADSPWNFVAWDLRGHGRSDGKRGFANHFDEYIEDFKSVLHFVLNENEINTHQIVLLSHSMGGLIQSQFYINEKIKPKIQGMIFSSPLFDVALAVPYVKDVGAQLINKYLPKLTLHNEINNTQLTADTEVLKEFQKDPYRHHKISAGVYLGFKESFLLIENKIKDLDIPCLFQLAKLDSVVSTPKAIEYFNTIKNSEKQLLVYENSHHEIYNDIERNKAFTDIKKFLILFEKTKG